MSFIFVRNNGMNVKINLDDIIFIEGSKNYVKIVTEKCNYLTLSTLKELEQILPADRFVRVHKSYIISIEKISSFNREIVNIGQNQIPVGFLYNEALENKVFILGKENVASPGIRMLDTA